MDADTLSRLNEGSPIKQDETYSRTIADIEFLVQKATQHEDDVSLAKMEVEEIHATMLPHLIVNSWYFL